MIKIYSTLLLAILCFTFKVHAQFGLSNDPELAKEALSRKLIVVLDELNSKEIKRYEKKGTLEFMEEECEIRNEKTKRFFTDHWKLTPVEFKTETQLDSILKTKTSKYIYVKVRRTADMKQKKDITGIMNKTYNYVYFIFKLSFTDSHKSLGAFTSRGQVLNDLEYICAINSLQYFIKHTAEGNKRKELEEEINANAGTLKSKTLLIPDYLTNLSLNDIKANYSFKVKVLPEEDIIELIDSKNPDYAYVYVNHKEGSCGTRFNHIIFDCGTGKPLLLDQRNGVRLGTGDYTNILDDVVRLKVLVGKDGSQPSLFKQKFVKIPQLRKYVKIINGSYDDKVEEEDGGVGE